MGRTLSVRDKADIALEDRVAALPDTTVLCAHCEHEIAECPKCGKAEWRIVP